MQVNWSFTHRYCLVSFTRIIGFKSISFMRVMNGWIEFAFCFVIVLTNQKWQNTIFAFASGLVALWYFSTFVVIYSGSMFTAIITWYCYLHALKFLFYNLIWWFIFKWHIIFILSFQVIHYDFSEISMRKTSLWSCDEEMFLKFPLFCIVTIWLHYLLDSITLVIGFKLCTCWSLVVDICVVND